MRERLTARVLLFDPRGDILLVRGRATQAADARSFWFTVGGGVDPGESLEAGALREIAEETGFTDVELGPVVWLRASVFTLADGETVILKESYFVARCQGGEPSRAAWEPHEVAVLQSIRDLGLELNVIFNKGAVMVLPAGVDSMGSDSVGNGAGRSMKLSSTPITVYIPPSSAVKV